MRGRNPYTLETKNVETSEQDSPLIGLAKGNRVCEKKTDPREWVPFKRSDKRWRALTTRLRKRTVKRNH